MTAIALVVANASYEHLSRLDCCREDAAAIHALLSATGRFEKIEEIVDRNSSELRSRARSLLDPNTELSELFFYFSGHGCIIDGDFFLCPTDFNPDRPHETGFSNSYLHDLIRDVSPNLVVKIIDACCSGALLVKSGADFLPPDKNGIKSLIQIASCLESQISLAGEPLSEFTEQLCLAAARNTAGQTYYTDIVNVIRDKYIDDIKQTPHFVFQCSARETFVDDANILEGFRSKFQTKWASPPKNTLALQDEEGRADPVETADFLELLRKHDERLANPEDVISTIGTIFDGARAHLENWRFADYYDAEIDYNSNLDDKGSKDFIARVLSQQNRLDNFVTATVSRQHRRPTQYGSMVGVGLGLFDEPLLVEETNLELNMNLDRAQMVITLTPRFMALDKIKLVVTCAPSLEICYLFERITRHPRTDFDAFDTVGAELARRWYRHSWESDPAILKRTITKSLDETIDTQLISIRERLAAP